MPNTSVAKKKWCILYQGYIMTKINFWIVSGYSLTKTPPDETQLVTHGFCVFRGTFPNRWFTVFIQNKLYCDMPSIQMPDIPEVTLWEKGSGFWRWAYAVIKILWKTRIKPTNEYTLNSLNKREISHHFDLSNHYPVRIEARPQVIFHSTSYTIRSLGATAPIEWSHMCLQCL